MIDLLKKIGRPLGRPIVAEIPVKIVQ